MESKVYQYYKELPPWAKGVVVIGVGVAAWTVYTRITSTLKNKKSQKESKEVIKYSNDEITKLNKEGVRQSYSDTQYKIWADAAFSCYSGWGTCTGDTIFINMKNDVDVLKLIQAFGVRTIPSGMLNPAPDFTGSLPSVMRDELSGSDLSSINRLLAKKGIKYQF
jgi:hypothetical protein